MKPREFFPNMPDEVFDNWLAPHIKLYGCPFQTSGENFSDYNWPNCFSIHHSLKQWAECEWELKNIPFELTNLHPRTINIIAEIISNAVSEHHTKIAEIERSKERFWACASAYKKRGAIDPIVIYYLGSVTRILDGFHRISSAIHIGYPQNFTIQAWEAKL